MARGWWGKRPKAVPDDTFLKALARTGNSTLAAKEAGISRAAMEKRRRRDPELAAGWRKAIGEAERALAKGAAPARSAGHGQGPPRTIGGELVVARGRNGRLQIRRSPPGRLSRAGAQQFLAQLARCANVRLAAEAAGIGWKSVYVRRQKDPEFDAEIVEALSMGADRLEQALLMRSAIPAKKRPSPWVEQASGEDLLPMTADQMLRLLNFHRNTVKLQRQLPDRRQLRPYDIEKVRERLERKMRQLRMIPDE